MSWTERLMLFFIHWPLTCMADMESPPKLKKDRFRSIWSGLRFSTWLQTSLNLLSISDEGSAVDASLDCSEGSDTATIRRYTSSLRVWAQFRAAFLSNFPDGSRGMPFTT